jgi:hypothetical protein
MPRMAFIPFQKVQAKKNVFGLSGRWFPLVRFPYGLQKLKDIGNTGSSATWRRRADCGGNIIIIVQGI